MRMVSPIFMVGSMCRMCVIVTRAATSGKWEICAIRGTFVPYEKWMAENNFSRGSGHYLYMVKLIDVRGRTYLSNPCVLKTRVQGGFHFFRVVARKLTVLCHASAASAAR